MEINHHYIKTLTKISSVTLGIPQDYKQKCIDEIYRLGDKMNNSTNAKAIMSSYFIFNESNIFNPLLNNIKSVLEYIYFPKENTYQYCDIYNAWSIVYKESHYTNYHNHATSHISFVYYLQCNEYSSPIVFDNDTFSITPKSDLLVVFPGNLMHSVPPHQDKQDRIALAGNVLFKSNDPSKSLDILPYKA